jgi:hypothetical protein
MDYAKTLTLPLSPSEYKRLEAEACRLGLTPSALALQYLRAALPVEPAAEVEARRRATLEALDRLAELTADLPPVDAVKIARESREELERWSII